ncbi:hypothetical protein D3C76_1534960 [compost metagenome]
MVGYRDVQVALQFLVDIDQRRRRGHARLHRETQAMGLARTVVWVLAKNDYFHLVQRCRVERIEDQRPWRVDLLAGGVLAAQELT